jgi:cupin fold WbuC family metalloprotein
MKLIDNEILAQLITKAKQSPRKRSHFNLHSELNDPVQRLCIAMEPETYVRPHRHSDPETWEVLMILRGSAAILFFDGEGKVLERTMLGGVGQVTAVEFPKSTWHAPVSLESGTVVFEVKQGPYRPIAEVNLAPWAPAEGKPETARFLAWYKCAKEGDLPPRR